MNVKEIKKIVIEGYPHDDATENCICSAIMFYGAENIISYSWKINDAHFLSHLELIVSEISYTDNKSRNKTVFDNIAILRLEIVQKNVKTASTEFYELLQIDIYLEDGREIKFRQPDKSYGTMQWMLR